MPWPSWAFWRQTSESDVHGKPGNERSREEGPIPTPPAAKAAGSWDNNLNRIDWSQFTNPQTLVFGAITAATTLALVRLYKTYLRRIPTVQYLKPGFFRRRNLYGYVTRVGDGDNFHLFHTPGGKWMGWGWLPRRRVQDMAKKAKQKDKDNAREDRGY